MVETDNGFAPTLLGDMVSKVRGYDALMSSIVGASEKKYGELNLIYNSVKKSYIDKNIARSMVSDIVKNLKKHGIKIFMILFMKKKKRTLGIDNN